MGDVRTSRKAMFKLSKWSWRGGAWVQELELQSTSQLARHFGDYY